VGSRGEVQTKFRRGVRGASVKPYPKRLQKKPSRVNKVQDKLTIVLYLVVASTLNISQRCGHWLEEAVISLSLKLSVRPRLKSPTNRPSLASTSVNRFFYFKVVIMRVEESIFC